MPVGLADRLSDSRGQEDGVKGDTERVTEDWEKIRCPQCIGAIIFDINIFSRSLTLSRYVVLNYLRREIIL
jgi:predicted transporter